MREQQQYNRRNRTRAIAAGLAVAVAVVMPLTSASAKAAKAGSGTKSTSFNASTFLFDTCQEGATCTHSASADRTGAHAAAASIERSEPFLTNEYSSGRASGSRSLHLNAPVPALRLTFTFQTVSASSTATATSPEGAAVGRVFARGSVLGCDGCEAGDDATNGYGPKVVDSYASAGSAVGMTASDEAIPGEVFTHTFTLRGRGGGPIPAGHYTLRGSTLAFAYVGCVSNSGQCFPEVVGHSGSASDAAMQLLDIKSEVVA